MLKHGDSPKMWLPVPTLLLSAPFGYELICTLLESAEVFPVASDHLRHAGHVQPWLGGLRSTCVPWQKVAFCDNSWGEFGTSPCSPALLTLLCLS